MVEPLIYFLSCILGILLSSLFPHKLKPVFWGFWGLVFLSVLVPASALFLIFVCLQALGLCYSLRTRARSDSWRKYGPYLLLLNLFWVDFHALVLGHFVETVGISFAVIRIFMTCKQLLSSRKDLKREFFKWITISGFYMPALMVGPVFSGLDLRKQQDAGPDHIKESTSFLYRHMVLGLSLSIVFAYVFNRMALYAEFGLGDAWWTLQPIFLFLTLFAAFWGQSLIAEMTSKISDYNIPQNFDAPWKAVGIKEFWQRWHISMSNFVMQYIFLPLSINKVNPKLATIAAFVFMGLWHNISVGYFIWGVSHGVLMAYWPRRPEVVTKWRINLERLATLVIVIALSYIANYAFAADPAL
jgi:D-alanyl-lipoteichoic acid acyltransferase DltB (MBOAT superfamily)